MNFVRYLVQLYLSTGPGDDWLPHVEMALVGIASVAAVVWTGGLVAYQLKQYTFARSVGLEIVQAAFLGAVFALFMHPATLRIVATVFTVYYVSSLLYAHYVQFRDIDATRKTLKAKAKSLTDEELIGVWISVRRYILYSLGTMIFYVGVVVWPYPKAVAWITSALLFLGLQTIMSHLNTAPDRGSFEVNKVKSLTTIIGQLQTLITQVAAILQKP